MGTGGNLQTQQRVAGTEECIAQGIIITSKVGEVFYNSAAFIYYRAGLPTEPRGWVRGCAWQWHYFGATFLDTDYDFNCLQRETI